MYVWIPVYGIMLQVTHQISYLAIKVFSTMLIVACWFMLVCIVCSVSADYTGYAKAIKKTYPISKYVTCPDYYGLVFNAVILPTIHKTNFMHTIRYFRNNNLIT